VARSRSRTTVPAMRLTCGADIVDFCDSWLGGDSTGEGQAAHNTEATELRTFLRHGRLLGDTHVCIQKGRGAQFDDYHAAVAEKKEQGE